MRRFGVVVAVLVVGCVFASAASALTVQQAGSHAEEHAKEHCGNWWTTRCEAVYAPLCVSTGANRLGVAQWSCEVHYKIAAIKGVLHRNCTDYTNWDPWGHLTWDRQRCGRWHFFGVRRPDPWAHRRRCGLRPDPWRHPHRCR